MKRLLPFLFFLLLSQLSSPGQSFTIDDLVKVANIPSKNLLKFMGRNGFYQVRNLEDTSLVASFEQKRKRRNVDTVSERSVEFFQRRTSRCYSYNTNVKQEYLDGLATLKKNGFIFDTSRDAAQDGITLFQKKNVVIEALKKTIENVPEYTFTLEEKPIPDMRDIKYAEDLLQFSSHEFLASFFGGGNVKKDMYYFTQNELKKCSVLFGKSSRQVIFVWGDQQNLSDLEYILVTKVAPTVEAVSNGWDVAKNEWKLRNGLYPGMSLKDLVKLNESDFEIYGATSDLAFMVKPSEKGKIDFQQTGVMLNCMGCNEESVFRRTSLSAVSLVRQDFPVYVYDLVVFNPLSRHLSK